MRCSFTRTDHGTQRRDEAPALTLLSHSLRRFRRRGFAGMAGLFLCGASLHIDAAPVRVTGILVSDDGQRIDEARVTISVPGQGSGDPHYPLLGRIDFPVEAGAATYLRARIESPHHQKRELNVDVIKGIADMGTVTLKNLPGILLSRLHYFPPGDLDITSGSFDIFVTNETSKEILIDSMKFVGTRKKKTDCGDLPGLHDYVFLIRNGMQVGSNSKSDLILDVHAAAGTDSVVAALGEIEYLPCDQARLSLTVNYPWSARPGDSRVRFILPLMPRRPIQPNEAPVYTSTDFREWDKTVLKVKLDDGREYSNIDG